MSKEKKSGISPIPGAKQFSSTYQPSGEAKRKGLRKYWDFHKARKQIFECLTGSQLPKGDHRNFWDAGLEKLVSALFSDESTLTEKEKVELVLKLIKELTPDAKLLEVDVSRPVVINFVEEKDS